MKTQSQDVINHPSPARDRDRAAGAVAAGLLVARVFGFVRDVTIAYLFGVSARTDAYLISANLPLVFDSLLGGTAAYSALLPVAVDSLNGRDEEGFDYVVSTVSALVMLVGGTVALAASLSCRWWVPAIAGGLGATGFGALNQYLAATLLAVPLLGLTNIAWAALNSRGIFWLPAITQCVVNAAIIVAALILSRWLGVGSLAAGYLAGCLLQVVVLYAYLLHCGFHFRPRLELHSSAVRRVLWAFWPLSLAGCVAAIGPAIDNYVATFLPAGGVTAIRYAQNLIMPLSVFTIAISMPALPYLSGAVSSHAWVEIGSFIRRNVRILGFVLGGASTALFLGGQAVIAVAYGRGAFDEHAVNWTSNALQSYALGVPFAATFYFLLRALVAFASNRSILILNIGILTLGVILDFALLPSFGVRAIGLSWSITQGTAVLVAAALISKRLEISGTRFSLITPLCPGCLAAILGCSTGWIVATLLNPYTFTGWVITGLSLVLGLGVFGVIVTVFGAADTTLLRRVVQMVRVEFQHG